MDEEEFATAISVAGTTYHLLAAYDWDEIVALCRRTDSVAPILHPSEYIAGRQNLRVNARVAEAARAFVASMKEVQEMAQKVGE